MKSAADPLPALPHGATPAPPRRHGLLALGAFHLDLAAGELRDAAGQPAALRRQALAVLLLLGRHAGQVVAKNALMAQVWPGVVVGEGSLTQAVADIRRVLGEHGHRLVRNVARRGYLLSADDTGPAPMSQRPGGAAPALSIAVLPLEPEALPAAERWLADALHADLITEVSRLIGSLVIARDTMVGYQGRRVDPRAVARELGVRHLVRGTLRLEGPRVRLNLALIDGETGAQRWADIFVTGRSQLPQALGEFAVQVDRALQAELYRATAGHALAASQPPTEADDLAMRAFALWFRGYRRAHVLEALPLLEQAARQDADCARAWAGIAFMRSIAWANGWAGELPGVRAQVDQAAAQLDRLDRDGHYTYQAKFIALFLRRQAQALLAQAGDWCARHPRPTAHGALGAALLMHGRFDAAAAALQQALRLSPRDPMLPDWQYRLAMAHFGAGRLEPARDLSLVAESTSPGLAWPPIHAAVLALAGQQQAAQRSWAAAAGRSLQGTLHGIDRLLPGDEARWLQARARLEQGLALAAQG